jgi:NodT family efflux transporter outer membrane factor (OMF) lipoprotein
MSVTRVPAIAALAVAAALTSSCAVGPDFARPAPPDADRYTRARPPTRTASTDIAKGQAQRFVTGLDIPAQWWTLFHSPRLNALIERALKANPTVEAAVAALRLGQENVYVQQGKFLPLVQANFNPTVGQTAEDVSPVLSTPNRMFTLYTAQVLVSYTFDVWGLNRRAVESLQAQADSQHFLLEGAYLTLTSSIAGAAIQEASLRAQIDTTNHLIDLNTKVLALLRRQFENGYVARQDVATQEAQLAQVKATLPPLRRQLAVQRDLLAALAGRFPSEEPPEKFELSALRLPLDLPVSVPSLLIEQRPDVRSAEQLLHSAAAQVGVAIANTLPNFTVNATGGYTATQLANLINPTNLFWTLAGNATQTVFDGFMLLHQKRAAEAAYDQAAATYRSTVITALQNVADALRAIQYDAQTLKAQREFARAAKISLDLARQQLESGYANFQVVLLAEQTYQQAVLAVVQTQAQRLADTVALFQALGGGWWNRVDRDPRVPPVVIAAPPPALASAKPVDVASAQPVTPAQPVTLIDKAAALLQGLGASSSGRVDAGSRVPLGPAPGEPAIVPAKPVDAASAELSAPSDKAVAIPKSLGGWPRPAGAAAQENAARAGTLY